MRPYKGETMIYTDTHTTETTDFITKTTVTIQRNVTYATTKNSKRCIVLKRTAFKTVETFDGPQVTYKIKF